MADGEGVTTQGDGKDPQFQVELRDSLPGGRAVISVVQEGTLTLLASKQHISEQASTELADQFQRIVRERWWNWPDR